MPRGEDTGGALVGWPRQPVILEVNAAGWLQRVAERAGREVRLGDVPDADWDELALAGIDAVWLMGVWERDSLGRQLARTSPALRAQLRTTLPDIGPDDVLGSAYWVRRYVADERFGGRHGLCAARKALARRGKQLILDYVPNHVAADHPWTTAHPDWFIGGTLRDAAEDPTAWVVLDDGTVVARAGDPDSRWSPGLVQLNAFSEDVRAATARTMASIAEQCDGIRCDMAMRLLNRVFAKSWNGRVGPEPPTEFWVSVIGRLRESHPDVVLMTESYWGIEWEMQQQGFDFCFDKRLYERIVSAAPNAVRDHLRSELAYQARLVRFDESHDAARIASLLPDQATRAAAVLIATLPGATLWHWGQFEGRRAQPSVFLGRERAEEEHIDLACWHRDLICKVGESGMRDGHWSLLEATGWPDNDSCDSLLCWSWRSDVTEGGYVIVVNLSDQDATGRVPLHWRGLRDNSWRLSDLMDARVVEGAGEELIDPGMFVLLRPWGTCVLKIETLGSTSGS